MINATYVTFHVRKFGKDRQVGNLIRLVYRFDMEYPSSKEIANILALPDIMAFYLRKQRPDIAERINKLAGLLID